MINFYTENGYIDMEKVISLPYPFIFVVHGRGTGKTYGAFKYLLDHPEKKFMVMRRTQIEADTIGFTDFSPFQPVLADNPEKYKPVYVGGIPHVKNISGVWAAQLDEGTGKLAPEGEPIGYICALNTISNIRGFNGEQIKIMIYDEFIPERGARSIKNEGEAIVNAYETINRNRELKGQAALKMVFLANANKLSSPIFQTLGIMDKIDKMAMTDQETCFLPDRGIAILKLRNSSISSAKADTALYRATSNREFAAMALKNEFDTSVYLYVQREPINEYKLVAVYEDVCIYRHKSKRWWYVSHHKRGTEKYHYIDEEFSRKKMKKDLVLFFDAWLHGNVSFEDYYCKLVLTNSL